MALQLHLEDVEARSATITCGSGEYLRRCSRNPWENVCRPRFKRFWKSWRAWWRSIGRTGPRSADPDRPRDVVCRLLRYAQKELILRRAWERGDVLFDGRRDQDSPGPFFEGRHYAGEPCHGWFWNRSRASPGLAADSTVCHRPIRPFNLQSRGATTAAKI